MNVPIQPLLNALPGRTVLDISRQTGVDRSGLHRAVRRGHLSIWTADTICTNTGLHLHNIYNPEDLDKWVSPADRRRLAANRIFKSWRNQEAAS